MAKKNNQFNLPYTGQEVQQAVANGLIAVTTDPEQTFDAETQQVLRDKLGMDNQRVEAVQQFDWAQNDPEDPSYIRNRTHYYAPPEFDISWDGEIGDRFAIATDPIGAPGFRLVKVDDRVFSVEQMRGSVLETTNGKDTYDVFHVEACNCDAYTVPGCYNVNGAVVVVHDSDKLCEAAGLPCGSVPNGTFFALSVDDGLYVSRFCARHRIKRIAAEFLPEGVPFVPEPEFDIIWDGNMEGRTALDMTAAGYDGFFFVKVSDEEIELNQLDGSAFFVNGGVVCDVSESSIDKETYPGAYAISNMVVVVYEAGDLNAAMGLPDGYLTNGVYFVANPAELMYVARFTAKKEPLRIPDLANVAYTGNYDDLINVPSLERVATTGSYKDLTDKPTIRTDVVLYATGQSLSDANKERARNNIGACSVEELNEKALPTVSDDDNGSFLMVVDGKWQKATVGIAEEATFGV